MLPLRDCIFPGEAWLGRDVTFQMENGDGIPVNLREMMAFGGIDVFFSSILSILVETTKIYQIYKL